MRTSCPHLHCGQKAPKGPEFWMSKLSRWPKPGANWVRDLYLKHLILRLLLNIFCLCPHRKSTMPLWTLTIPGLILCLSSGPLLHPICSNSIPQNWLLFTLPGSPVLLFLTHALSIALDFWKFFSYFFLHFPSLKYQFPRTGISLLPYPAT